jgi:hypothetical protein
MTNDNYKIVPCKPISNPLTIMAGVLMGMEFRLGVAVGLLK